MNKTTTTLRQKIKTLRDTLSIKKKQPAKTKTDKKKRKKVVSRLKTAITSLTKKIRQVKKNNARKDQNTVRCYVGSAYSLATDDMARNPSQWSTVRSKAGFWLHGNIFEHLLTKDESVLKQFIHKRYIVEGDISWLEQGNTALPFIFEWMKQRGFTCDGVAMTVPTDRILRNTDQVAKDLDKLLAPIHSKGAKCYLLMQVVSPESTTPAAVALLTNGYRGEKVWNYIVKRSATCSGTILDHPAHHWVHVPMHNHIALDLAKTSLATLGKTNFMWLLNGGTNQRDTKTLLLDIKEAKVTPSQISVSHFEVPTYRGIPESGESVTGQALEAVRFYE
jgi:hypothetical protein